MLPRAQLKVLDLRRTRSHSAAVEVLQPLEACAPQQRLFASYHAHAAEGILPAKRHYVLKRTLDLALGVPAFLLTLPLYPFITLIIRLESPGPGLYRQVRVGKDGRPFVAYKFRTMRCVSPEQARAAHMEIVSKWMSGTPVSTVSASSGVPATAGHAESLPVEINTHNRVLTSAVGAVFDRRSHQEQRGMVASFKHTSDPRITWTGRIFRKLSIDELPQLINVVRGEMSLVGPRPSLPYEVERYSERALARLRVLPGLTGKWQVEGRGQVDFDDMVEMDLDYAAKGSLWRDVVLILRTIPAVIRCRGAG